MKMTNHWVRIVAVGLLCLIGTERVHAAKRARYEETAIKQGGTIVGVVRFEGKIPKPAALKVTSTEKACLHGSMPDERLVVSDKKRIKWAVARIKKIVRGKPFPKQPVGDSEASSGGEGSTKKKMVPMGVMNQKGCRFIPHVALAPERRPFKILNSDGILHNVHTYAKFNAPLNKAMQANVKEMEVTFKRRERILVRCDIHKWMRGWIIVAEHPYYAVTGDDGAFRLDKVPAGTYTIEVWHETLGKQQKKVTVEAGKDVKVEYVFKKK